MFKTFNIFSCHTAVEEVTTNSQLSEKKLLYKHRIESGVTKIENYGLSLAARTNLPVETVNLAIELAEVIGRNNKVLHCHIKQVEEVNRNNNTN